MNQDSAEENQNEQPKHNSPPPLPPKPTVSTSRSHGTLHQTADQMITMPRLSTPTHTPASSSVTSSETSKNASHRRNSSIQGFLSNLFQPSSSSGTTTQESSYKRKANRFSASLQNLLTVEEADEEDEDEEPAFNDAVPDSATASIVPNLLDPFDDWVHINNSSSQNLNTHHISKSITTDDIPKQKFYSLPKSGTTGEISSSQPPTSSMSVPASATSAKKEEEFKLTSSKDQLLRAQKYFSRANRRTAETSKWAEYDFSKLDQRMSVQLNPIDLQRIMSGADQQPEHMEQEEKSDEEHEPRETTTADRVTSPISKFSTRNATNDVNSDVATTAAVSSKNDDVGGSILDQIQQTVFQEMNQETNVETILNDIQHEISMPVVDDQGNEVVKKPSKEMCYKIASLYIQDAISNRNFRHKFDTTSLRILNVLRHPIIRAINFAVIFILFALAIFEYPEQAVWFPFGVTHSVELVCLVYILIEVILRYRASSFKFFSSQNIDIIVRIAVIIATTIDITINLISLGKIFRFTRILRTLFLIGESKNVLGTYKYLLIVFRKMFEIIILLLLLVALYTGLGRIIFQNIPNDIYFGTTFFDSYLHMFTLLTTANFPDVMIPAAKVSKFYSIYFIFFVAVGLYFVYNLSLAIVYNFYKISAKQEAVNSWKNKRTCLLAAFTVLDYEKRGFVDLEQFQNLFKYLKPTARYGEAIAFFSLADQDGDGFISAIDFLKLCDVLEVVITEKKVKKYRFKILQKLKQPLFPVIKQFLDSAIYRVISGSCCVFAILLNAFVIMQDESELSTLAHVIFHVLDTSLIIVFVTEVFLYIFGIGLAKYFKSDWLRLDFAIIVIQVFVKIVLEAFFALLLPLSWTTSHTYLRIIIFLRMIVVFRLFVISRRLRVLMTTFMRIFMLVAFFFVILFIQMYFFAIIGMELFGETIKKGDPRLLGSGYDLGDYYGIICFDDIISAYSTLFHLMVVNNWHVTARAHIAVTSEWAIIYFVAYHVTTVTVMLNLLIAFIVEAFVFKWDERVQEIAEEISKQKQKEDKLQNSYERANPTTVSEELNKENETKGEEESQWTVKKKGKMVTNVMDFASNQLFKDSQMENEFTFAKFIMEQKSNVDQLVTVPHEEVGKKSSPVQSQSGSNSVGPASKAVSPSVNE